jgi:glycosyltransferase involved in cell wall biosynthesis
MTARSSLTLIRGDADGARTVTSTVLVPTFDRNRVPLLSRCLESLLVDDPRPDQTIVVVDSDADLARYLRHELAELTPLGVEIIDSDGRGAAQARNTGLGRATGDIVVCLDDDAHPDPGCLAAILQAFDDSDDVVALGGRITPDYAGEAHHLPEELLWVVGATYRGHRVDRGPISRPIGACMAFRRRAMSSVGGFSPDFGPTPGEHKSNSNEEIVLAEALRRRFGSDSIIFVPEASVRHHVPARRTAWSYLLSRSWAEGVSKAAVRALYDRGVMADDSSYAWRVLVPAVFRYTSHAQLRKAIQCVVTGAVTAAGYAFGRARTRVRRHSTP